MLTIVICVGSSCYVRGSDKVAGILERLIEQQKLREHIQLKGAFCMEHCSLGVSVSLGEQFFMVHPENTESFFYSSVLPRLEQESK